MNSLNKPAITLVIKRRLFVIILVIARLNSNYVYCITIFLSLISQVLAVNVRCSLSVSTYIGLCNRLALTMMSMSIVVVAATAAAAISIATSSTLTYTQLSCLSSISTIITTVIMTIIIAASTT